MTDDLIRQLRARNPAPGPLHPPPIEGVLDRIAADERPAGRRWTQWVGPALAIGVAGAVGTVAVVSLHAGPQPAPSGQAPRQTTAGPPPGPGDAMRGALQQSVLGFGPSGTGVIGWTQVSTKSTVRPKAWLATTSDGGSAWSVERRSFSLFANPEFDGRRDGWTQGLDPHQALRFYFTHNGGRSWAPGQSAAAANSVQGDVSVAGGVVWAVGTGNCRGTACRWIVMRGPASGDRLPATAGQPLPATDQNSTTISASSATTAYVATPARHGTLLYATDDGGQKWHQIPDPCSNGSSVFGLTATSTGSLWRVCVQSKRFLAARSTDGGLRWSSRRLPFIPLYQFEPVSNQVAWSQDVHGTIYRTADGGATWQPVWRSGGPHQRATPGISPTLSAQSTNQATLLVQLIRGPVSRNQVPRSTNLIVYRTSTAGRSWHPSVIKLPHG